MEDDYHLQKFKADDLKRYEYFKKTAHNITYVKDSVDYLLLVLQSFEDYVIDRIFYKGAKGIRLRKVDDNQAIKENPMGIINRLEKYEDELTLEERVFKMKIENLIISQRRRVFNDATYPESRLRNISNYLLEEHKLDKEVIMKERIIWLGGKGKVELLVKQWKENNFIEQIETEIVLSIFCDPKGELYSVKTKKKIKWIRKNTELALFISGMTTSDPKLISDENVWVKVCKCFINNNEKELKPNNLAVSFQKGNPQNRDIIKKIIKNICSSDQFES